MEQCTYSCVNNRNHDQQSNLDTVFLIILLVRCMLEITVHILVHVRLDSSSCLFTKQVVKVIGQEAASPQYGWFGCIRQVALMCTPI